MIALAGAAAAMLALSLSLIRLVLGPTLYDRVLATHAMASGLAVVCAAYAALTGRDEIVDAALGIVLGALVLLLATLKFFRVRSFQPPLARYGRGDVE